MAYVHPLPAACGASRKALSNTLPKRVCDGGKDESVYPSSHSQVKMLGLDAYGSSDDEEEAQPLEVKTWNHTKHNSKNQLLMAAMAGELNHRARATESTGRWCVRGARNKRFPFRIS